MLNGILGDASEVDSSSFSQTVASKEIIFRLLTFIL